MNDYKPRTKLGEKLWGLRSRVAASGARPLDWDEIEQLCCDDCDQPHHDAKIVAPDVGLHRCKCAVCRSIRAEYHEI
jgi:hypothetical protein